MIKQMAIIGILILITSSQTIVTPKTQKCDCSNIINQMDCYSQQGCSWIPQTTNNNDSNNTLPGSCNSSNSNTQIVTLCSSISNSTLCSKTIGCAFFNNSCILFSGCSAYVQTTNSQCQAISSQCTSDGTRCVDPSSCQQYNISSLCIDNIATSGAKTCKWVETGSQGSCQDKVCSDAPNTYNTDQLCNGWIIGCLSTGQGCTSTLKSCSTYTFQASGCTGMIGSDGPCIANTDQGSALCRPLACTDAPNTLTKNTDCSKFLQGCLTTGKGCIKTLQSCNLYQQSQGCANMIGSEGPCIIDTTSTTVCRALSCGDAPISLNTNSGCNQFLNNCVTTGQGCIKTLGLCSSFNGSESQCNLYIGSDGNCKGTSSSIQQCSVRTCGDAPKSINTDLGCNTFQKGCITNGVGCVVTLQLCQQYIGTATTCLLYKGSDGNCTAPSNQTTDGSCNVKLCSNATQNTNTNSGCQQYSYKCVTNGTECIPLPTCETTQSAITCEGNSACSSSQICLDRTSCTNYYNQSICSLNQQQYQVGSKVYLRKCQWTNTCQNILCSSLSTTLKTDSECEAALSGCVTKGNGCADINDNCSVYSGLISTCQRYKGLNGQQVCTQLNTETNLSTPCVAITQCSQAKLYSQVTQSSDKTCDTFLKGCSFNGNDNCTQGDCTNFIGNLAFCQTVSTAISSNKPQKCFKVDQPNNVATQCIPRICQHATATASEPFNTDTLCQGFLQNCVWNGKSSGGCQDSSTSCTKYVGSIAQCKQYSLQRCTKTSQFCLSTSCYAKVLDSTQSKNDQQKYCQGIVDTTGFNCYSNGGTTCLTPEKTIISPLCDFYIPIGVNDNEKKNFCQSIKQPTFDCTYVSGKARCSSYQCTDYTVVGDTPDQISKFCQSKIQYQVGFFYICGLMKITDKTCSILTPGAYGFNLKEYCLKLGFIWNNIDNNCYQQNACSTTTIPDQFQTSLIQKAKFCNQLTSINYYSPCTYSTTSGDLKSCSEQVDNCQKIQILQTLSTSDKLQLCLSQRNQNGQQCILNSDSSTCANFDCNLLLILAPKTDIELQQYCLSQLTPCGYDNSNKSNCQTFTDCSQYKTYGADKATNIALCQKYKANNQYCAYEAGSTCTVFSCNMVEDKNLITCAAFHPSCQFNGQFCVYSTFECPDYSANTSGEGKYFNCTNMKNKNGIKCGYKSGDYCKDRDCDDIETNGSDSKCKSYLDGCIFNGVGCWVPSSCDTYTAFGANLNEKSEFCKSRVNTSGKCAYIPGQDKCSIAQNACNGYQISSFIGTTPEIGCSSLSDGFGGFCSYSSGPSCTNLNCDGAPSTVNSDSDCSNFRAGCILATQTECADKACSEAPKTLSTDRGCATYRYGCITNGAGCIESSSNCSDFKGTPSTCTNFKANNGTQLCGKSISAAATDPCSNRTCQQNITAKNNQDCDIWIPPNGNNKNCVWNGTSGCIDFQQCSSFQGTVETCPKYIATDGPCQGNNYSIQGCFPYVCNDAPSNYNSDALCKQWGPTCMTNGQGCIPIGQCQSIGSHPVCSSYKISLGCDLASQCRTKPQQCSDFISPSECNNTPLTGLTLPSCGWNQKTNICGVLTCINLPLTLTTELQCSQSISNCTTTGSGCITKGACSTYTKQVCGIASTTDASKVCIWSNQTCRPIQCTDNTTANTDIACNTYLTGCKTTGSGCAQSVACQQYTQSQFCLKDSNGNPCLWLKTQQNQQGSCINYTKCSDVISSSHQDCQNASPHCTTNGTNCIAITSCSKNLLQTSCIIGTDGVCGWLASGSNSGNCANYTNCTVAKGTTTQQCKLWGKSCISDGVSCIQISTCSTYSTQQACSNQGTDGVCLWELSQQNQGTCRLQLCSDATTNNKTHAGCSQQKANTPCTTSEFGCIPYSTCKSYKVQGGCVIGTDGECFWQSASSNSTESSLCRLKQCSDIILTTSSSCLNSISGVKCVSNGVNCIQQSVCQNYTTREACLGGGTDGQCAFIPNSTTDQQNGQCQLFASCEFANQDQVTCSTRQDSCYFNSTTINGTITTQCQPHTCSTKALAQSCQPIPSFDLQTYKICILIGTTCSSGSPNQLTSTDCYQNSVQTYSWNPTTSSCRACKVSSQVENVNNETNQTRSDSKGYQLAVYIIAFYII